MTDTQSTLKETSQQTAPTPPLFIEDGWTIKGKINEEPGVHQELNLSYRPMTWIERRRLAREQEAEKDEDKKDQIRAKQVVARIIQWDQGPVSVEKVNQLSPIAFAKLEAVLFGISNADQVEVDRKN